MHRQTGNLVPGDHYTGYIDLTERDHQSFSVCTPVWCWRQVKEIEGNNNTTPDKIEWSKYTQSVLVNRGGAQRPLSGEIALALMLSRRASLSQPYVCRLEEEMKRKANEPNSHLCAESSASRPHIRPHVSSSFFNLPTDKLFFFPLTVFP